MGEIDKNSINRLKQRNIFILPVWHKASLIGTVLATLHEKESVWVN